MAVYTEDFAGAAADLTTPWVQGRSFSNQYMARDGSGAGRAGTLTTGDSMASYNNTVGNDQYSQVTVNFSGASSDFVYLFLRAGVGVNWEEGTTGNFAYWFWSNGTSNTKIQYINDSINSLVVIDTANSFTFTAGDVLKLEVVGTTIKLYKNGTAITWTTSGTNFVTDSHVTTGFPAMGLSVSAAGKTVDNWEGGDVSVATSVALTGVSTPATINSVVAGLSGFTLSGRSATGSVGTQTPSTSVPLVGQFGLSELGYSGSLLAHMAMSAALES
jgi:hypothetical protein